MNTELLHLEMLKAYAKRRADRLDQVRSKIAVLNAIIDDIEAEANNVYNTAMGDQFMGRADFAETFAALDKEYADMAADLRSARETNRVLLAHLTAALVRAPFLNLFANGDTPNES